MKKYVLSIKTSESINYLNKVLLVFNRRRVEILDLNIYKVEPLNYVKFNVIFEAEVLMANNLYKQIDKQIDIEEVILYLWDTVAHRELGVYSLHKTEDHKKMALKDLAREYKAKLIELEDVFIIEKAGEREVLDELRDELVAHHLLDFSYSGPIGVLNSNIHKELTV